MTACSTLTVDFVFVTSAKAAGTNNYGEVDVFEVNSESGQMRQIPTSPFPSGGRNPVAEAVSSDNTNLYVVNQDDNSIVQFIIGNDGKLYPQNTVNTPGIYPLGSGRERDESVRRGSLSATADMLDGGAVFRIDCGISDHRFVDQPSKRCAGFADCKRRPGLPAAVPYRDTRIR